MACCIVGAYTIMHMLNLYRAIDDRISSLESKPCDLPPSVPIDQSDGHLSTCRISITGMTCTSCSGIITKSLGRIRGVLRSQVSHTLAVAIIAYDTRLVSVEILISKVEELGFDACPALAKPTWRSTFQDAEDIRQTDIDSWRSTFLFSLGPTVIALLLAWPTGGRALTSRTSTHEVTNFLCAAFSVLYCAARVHKEAYSAVRTLRANMSLLSSVGLLAGFSQPLAELLLETTSSSRLSFNGVTFLTTIVLGGRLLKTLVSRRSLAAITTLVASMPKTASLMSTHDLESNWYENSYKVPADVLEKDDWVIVAPGEVVPMDGTIVQGYSEVLETNVTGEIIPKHKKAGDCIFEGSTNQSTPIVVKLRSAAGNSWLEKTLDLAASADSEKATQQDLISAVTENFVSVVLMVALLNALVGRIWLHHSWAETVKRVTAILLCACPCAMGLSIPSCSMICIALCSKLNISLVAGSSQIRVGAGIRTVLFDKTGTLTQGNLTIESTTLSEYWNSSDEQRTRFWTLITSLEQQNTHPVALAVLEEGRRLHPFHGISRVQETKQDPGLGVQGMVRISDQLLYVAVGNIRYMESFGLSRDDRIFNNCGNNRANSVFVSIDGRPAGILTYKDRLRADAEPAIYSLQQQGINVGIVTGASRESTIDIAKALNIDPTWVWTDLLPNEKTAALENIKRKYGPIAVVGDNMNDLPALAAASFSLFMSENSGLVSGAGADAIIASSSTKDDLMRIPWLIQLTREATRCMRQNIIWAVFYNATAILLSSGALERVRPFLKLSPFAASLGMSLSGVIVLINSMRLERWQSGLLSA